jgi:hypothetical protein
MSIQVQAAIIAAVAGLLSGTVTHQNGELILAFHRNLR